MAELVAKRWFQVISVIVILLIFLIVMASIKSREKDVVPQAAGVVVDVCGIPITRLEYQSVISRRTIKQYQKERMVRAADRERLHLLAFKDLVNHKLLDK